MNEETEGGLDNSHADGNAIIGEEYVGRIGTLTEEPEESIRDDLIVNK